MPRRTYGPSHPRPELPPEWRLVKVRKERDKQQRERVNRP